MTTYTNGSSKNKQHFDLSDSVRPKLNENTNMNALGTFKDELNTLRVTEFLALNPKVYSINTQTLNEVNELNIENKKTFKGVSNVVVKKEIEHDDYVNFFGDQRSTQK